MLELGFAAGQDLVVHQLDVGVPATLVDDSPRLGVRRYALATPLPTGATTTLTFDLELPTHGFLALSSNTARRLQRHLPQRADRYRASIDYQERGELEHAGPQKFGLAAEGARRATASRDQSGTAGEDAFKPDANHRLRSIAVWPRPTRSPSRPATCSASGSRGQPGASHHYRMDARSLTWPPSKSAQLRRRRRTCGTGRRATSRSTSTTSPATSSTSIRWTLRPRTRWPIAAPTSAPTSTGNSAFSSSRATRNSRSRSRTPFLTRKRSASSPGCDPATRRTSTIPTT